MTTSTPRWDLTNVYPSLEAPEFAAAIAEYKKQVSAFGKFFNSKLSKLGAKSKAKDLAPLIGEALERLNKIYTLSGTLFPFIASYVSTNSRDLTAKKILSEMEQASLPMNQLQTQFTAWLGTVAPKLGEAAKLNPSTRAHVFMLKEAAEQSKYLMSEAEENLATELTLSGGNAFGKLQGTVTSQMTVDFELDGQTQKMPMPALINLRSHPDEATRRRGYDAENVAWLGVQETLAACLNGVKGEAHVLNKKRGRKDALHASIDAARMDRKTLNAMLAAMQDSFPMFRRYYKSKAQKIGKEKLAWWDIFAPVGKADKAYTFEEARAFILENFGRFSPELSAFAKRAFDERWIDAEQREGKRGGAFCMGVEGVRESRILSNFDGSFDQVSTLAHELGHAFHNECAYQANKTPLQQITPMTLAETASTMCETIVTEAVRAATKDPQEELAVLEAQIQGAAQVVVDIYSRYLFEQEVFERRAQSELSAEDFNDIMERAQKATYGDGLDERYLQKYMWTWKPHYYSPELAFYNYPYAFGLLFATGLYAIYQQRGADFVEDYKNLLASTGEETAAKLAKRFGIDLTQRKFWDDSLAIIGKQIDRYCEL
ncbi:MAG: M3 family oligoendopeptidase [Anaerolineales bacterium]|nr:M3 family oligoendopeptidase [Anaerolineales bacterium]